MLDWFALNVERGDDWPLEREETVALYKNLSTVLAQFT